MLVALMEVALFLGGMVGALVLQKTVLRQNRKMSIKTITNPLFLLSIGGAGISLASYVLLLSQLEISLVQPLTLLSNPLVVIASVAFLKEKVTKRDLIGVALIIIGAFLVVV